jgi:ribosomal protein S18 acetylase RimI-like enzyme
MTKIDEEPRAADAAAGAWIGAMRRFAAAQPDGSATEGPHDTWTLVTGAAMPFLNGVVSIAAHPDPEAIAALAASPRLGDLAWSVQVRSAPVHPWIAATAAEHGLRNELTLPFMLKALDEADRAVRAPAPDGIALRRIGGDEHDLYRAALAAGYQGPEEVFGVFTRRALLDHPSMRAYVAELDGAVVATSFGVLVDDHVGVFNVAVAPEHRRRGYGRAATAAVLRDACEAGARSAFLHASELGEPLYAEMGFATAERWVLHVP